MATRGEHTITEIMSQPAIWKEARAVFDAQAESVMAFWKAQNVRQVILTGCGSTYYLSYMGAMLLQEQLGIPARAYPASELILFPHATVPTQAPANTLLITVSRSGATRETNAAARLFQKQGSKVLVITCHSESELAQLGDLVLAVDAAQEQSRVQTRSFSSMTVLLTLLSGMLAGGDNQSLAGLPDVAERVLQGYADLARELGENQDITQFTFLGSGVLYGLACEAMLKMAEMSLVPSTAFQALEFMHGPRYTVTEQTLIAALLTESVYDEEIRALQEAKRRGAQILAIVEDDAGTDLVEWCHVVRLKSGLPVGERAILYLLVLQLLGYHQAMVRGKNPDQPK